MQRLLKTFLVDWGYIVFPFVYLVARVSLHTGYKEGYGDYFFMAAFCSLLLVTFTTKSIMSHTVKSLFGLYIFASAAELYWSYMDHPWFAGPETGTCDGPCFGWFSFENDAPTMWILLLGCGFLLVTGVVKMIILYGATKLMKKRNVKTLAR